MATIHQLPGAAAEPPVQVRGKRRFPKHIVPIHCGRAIKKRHAHAAQLIAVKLTAIEMFEHHAELARAEIAELQQLMKG